MYIYDVKCGLALQVWLRWSKSNTVANRRVVGTIWVLIFCWQAWSIVEQQLVGLTSKSWLCTLPFRCNSFLSTFLEFEVNVVIVLHDDHLITENFPLKLCRVWHANLSADETCLASDKRTNASVINAFDMSPYQLWICPVIFNITCFNILFNKW